MSKPPPVLAPIAAVRVIPPTSDKRLELRDGESVTALLLRAGAGGLDAAQGDKLVSEQVGDVPPGTRVKIVLGPPLPGGARRIETAELRVRLGLTLRLRSSGDDLSMERIDSAVDATPVRLRGEAGPDLAATLTRLGLPVELARSAHGLLAREGGELRRYDRFDLIIAARHSAGGEREFGSLLYAGLDRASSRDLQLVRSGAGGTQDHFVDALSQTPSSPLAADALLRPVAGAITSGYGWRFHPLLHFPRYHRGIDIAASRGTPVRAAAAGRVVSAGWAGGHGYRIRLAHPGGTLTSYSHLAGIIVDPGRHVAAGTTIGTVGSTGLSTGPHLHFEVHRHGNAIPPLLGSHVDRATTTPGEVARARAQLRHLLSREFRELES